jgi:MFS transporter, AAHS family, 4-hydroxybenzoate transporter
VAANLLRADLAEIIAGRRMGRLHFDVVAMCAVVMFMDGYCTQSIGFAAPRMARALVLGPGALAPIFQLGGLGALAGIVLGAPLADRIGRKPVILGSLLLFAITSFATGFAGAAGQIATLRLFTGLGLGAMVPAVLALVADFMPRRHQIVPVTVVWLAFAVGAGLAGPIAAPMATRYGWGSVFILGGLMPLVVAPIFWTWLPDSLFTLARHGEPARPEIRATLIRISRRYDFLRTTEYICDEARVRGFPGFALFAAGRARFTVLVWLMLLMSLLVVSFFNSWLAPILENTRASDATVTAVIWLTQLAGVFGGLCVATMTEHYDRFLILAGSFVLSALALAAVAVLGGLTVLAIPLVLAAGFFVMGAQNAANAVVTASYPPASRATGVGWALGVGRAGQIAAPMIGSALLGLGLSGNHVLFLIALPGLFAAVAAAMIALSAPR